MLEPPRDLTLPEGSTATTRRVLSAALKRLLGDLGRLPIGRASAPIAESLRAVLRATRVELEREPGRVFGILRRPNVGAVTRVLRGAVDAPRDRVDALAAQLAATLAVELAASGAALPPLSFPATPDHVVCLSGRFVLPGGPARLENRGWTTGGARRELAKKDDGSFHPIERELLLATVDDNPLSMFEAHPDKEGNAIDLGGRSPDAWCEALRDSLSLVEAHLPLVREEIDLLISQLVPVGYDEHAHLSASYQEAIGTIYLSLHPSRMTMTEAIVHEHQHNKLNALFELDPVLHNAFHPLFTSPVRPDPRPLHGVLLAVHAFLPVAELYRRMIEAGAPGSGGADFRRRYAQILEVNRQGAEVLLANAKPTEVGRGLLDEIARLVQRA